MKPDAVVKTAATQPDARNPEAESPPAAGEHEVQQGGGHSVSRDDALKRQIRRHTRDEPLIDSVEDDELPPP
jgi:hypothetical protein